MLVVDAEGQRLHRRSRRDRVRQAQSRDFADAEHAERAGSRHVAVRIDVHQRRLQSRIERMRDVVDRDDSHLIDLLRRRLVLERNAVDPPEYITIAQGGDRAQRSRVDGRLIIELEAPVQRQVIAHLQRQIDGSWFRSCLQHRYHGPVGRLGVHGGELGLELRDLQHRPRRGRRQAGDHVALREIARPADLGALDAPFGHAQPYDSLVDRLRRNIDEHRAETLIVIKLLERRARRLDVRERLGRSQQGIKEPFDGPPFEHRIADDAVFLNLEALVRGRRGRWFLCGRRGRRLLGGRRGRLRSANRGRWGCDTSDDDRQAEDRAACQAARRSRICAHQTPGSLTSIVQKKNGLPGGRPWRRRSFSTDSFGYIRRARITGSSSVYCR